MCVASDGGVSQKPPARNGMYRMSTAVLIDKMCNEILCLQKSE